MFNVKSQNDYDGLSWENRLRYNAANPGSDYAKNELKRTKSKLYSNPTPEAENWYAQQQYVANGGNAENSILGNFDQSAFKFQREPWVRELTKSYGIADDRVGFQNGKVTLDGKDFLEPEAVADGKSYTSTEAFKSALRNYNQNNEVVGARDYINQKNPAVNVGWDAELGQVLVGSQRLTPDYITPDGRAQVSRAKVDEALRKEAETTGVYSRRDILNQNNDRWEKRLERLYDRVENPDPFTYSAEDDPLYQEFKRVWMDQSQKQYDDTIAKLNSQSGGAPSLGAMAAAWNMLQDSNGQLDAYKQQFRQQAYDEYVDEYNRDVTRLETALGMRDKEFEREYGVNNDVISDKFFLPEWESEMRSEALNQEATQENIKRSRQIYNQAEEMFPYELEGMKLTNEKIREALATERDMRPLEIREAALRIRSGELEVTAQEMEILEQQAKRNGITLNFNRSQSSTGGSGNSGSGGGTSRKTGGKQTDYGSQPVKNTAYTSAVDQISNIVNEPGRAKGQGIMEALRYVAKNGNLSDQEKADILSQPGLFGATESELNAAWSRITS